MTTGKRLEHVVYTEADGSTTHRLVYFENDLVVDIVEGPMLSRAQRLIRKNPRIKGVRVSKHHYETRN